MMARCKWSLCNDGLQFSSARLCRETRQFVFRAPVRVHCHYLANTAINAGLAKERKKDLRPPFGRVH
eukprot:463119-Pelagomonas_calceolata.AAC.3